jgi:DNA-binding IclR family transcriptional regulator
MITVAKPGGLVNARGSEGDDAEASSMKRRRAKQVGLDSSTPGTTGAAPPAQEKETGTVRRVLMLLSCLVDHPDASAQSLATRLNLPRSSVHRLLAMLRADGFADSEAGSSFRPGPELFRIAGRLAARMPYRKIAEPYLQALSAEFQETSILALLLREQLKMYYAAKGSPPDPMRYNIELGALEPLVWGATARVMLAHLSEDEIAAALKRREPSPARQLQPDETEVRKSLGRMRRDGYGITHGHRTLYTVGIAAPFFDGEGNVAGSLGFLIPEFRWAPARQDAVVRALADAAARMSRQLGYAGNEQSAPSVEQSNRRDRRQGGPRPRRN